VSGNSVAKISSTAAADGEAHYAVGFTVLGEDASAANTYAKNLLVTIDESEIRI
jgi:hypothetical protein